MSIDRLMATSCKQRYSPISIVQGNDQAATSWQLISVLSNANMRKWATLKKLRILTTHNTPTSKTNLFVE